MTMGVFSPLILELNKQDLGFTIPQSYKEYKLKNSINNNAMTASVISVDFLDRLDSELKQNETMVFRLGSPKGGNGTHFALAKCKNVINDYFLDESILKKNSTNEIIYLDKTQSLNAFKLLPKLTETSLVNLAFASGILAKALNLDEDTKNVIPATCQSTFSFKVRPHEDYDIAWEHNNGQVEIDALFYGTRKGVHELYLVESKFGSSHSTLAKHKLVYPFLAINKHINSKIRIVPVYLKTSIQGNSIHVMVTECIFKGNSHAVSSLKPLITKSFLIEDFLSNPQLN